MFSPEWGYSFLKDKGCYFLTDEKVTKESPRGGHMRLRFHFVSSKSHYDAHPLDPHYEGHWTVSYQNPSGAQSGIVSAIAPGVTP